MDQTQLLNLAPYAMDPRETAGRQFPETDHPYRGPFGRDRDRIVHSSAFRRLAHKTQVFTGHMGDYHRSRLTHTLEVASIARTIGRALNLNEDLIEALALMHDIGHPPFGHAGEEVLDLCCQGCGGFNHNGQALRIVTLLENRYPEFPGLNLSAEVLASQRRRVKGQTHPDNQPLLEAQVVDAADSIAYDTHDADDALELGLLEFDELLAVPLWKEAAQQVESRYTNLGAEDFRRAVIHQLIETLVSDIIRATQMRLQESAIKSTAQVVEHDAKLATPSDEYTEQKTELERFLFRHVYRHKTVLEERDTACAVLQELFDRHIKEPESLPEKYAQQITAEGAVRSTCDYLANMTDRFAWETHRNM